MQTFSCSKCLKDKPRSAFHEAAADDRQREVTSQCRDCRSEKYFERRYPDTVCGQCLKHRPLDKNKICSQCNEDTGLRECKGECGELLSVFLAFYDKRKVCNSCAKAAKLKR